MQHIGVASRPEPPLASRMDSDSANVAKRGAQECSQAEATVRGKALARRRNHAKAVVRGGSVSLAGGRSRPDGAALVAT